MSTYFVTAGGDEEEFSTRERAEQCVSELLQENTDPEDIRVIKGEEVEFICYAKFREPASK